MGQDRLICPVRTSRDRDQQTDLQGLFTAMQDTDSSQGALPSACWEARDASQVLLELGPEASQLQRAGKKYPCCIPVTGWVDLALGVGRPGASHVTRRHWA